MAVVGVGGWSRPDIWSEGLGMLLPGCCLVLAMTLRVVLPPPEVGTLWILAWVEVEDGPGS
jgi:hypothetical protein